LKTNCRFSSISCGKLLLLSFFAFP
jgi:hypothetical protein